MSNLYYYCYQCYYYYYNYEQSLLLLLLLPTTTETARTITSGRFTRSPTQVKRYRKVYVYA